MTFGKAGTSLDSYFRRNEFVKQVLIFTTKWEMNQEYLNEGRWRGTESNRRRRDFQSLALPTELPRRVLEPCRFFSELSIVLLLDKVNYEIKFFFPPRILYSFDEFNGLKSCVVDKLRLPRPFGSQ